MQENRSLALEARVSVIGGKDPCHLCKRYQPRVRDNTEIYVADTELWVCADCAWRIDPKLARFAWGRRLLFGGVHYGECPECGDQGQWRNIGRAHWAYCGRHGLKWWVGDNLYSSWHQENEDDWRRNEIFLMRFREIDFYSPRPGLFTRIALWLQCLISRARHRGIDQELLPPDALGQPPQPNPRDSFDQGDEGEAVRENP